MIEEHPIWNTLEIAKLIVSSLTPIIVIMLGLWINRRVKHLEDLQWASRKLVEKRLEIFDQFDPQLNDLLCYFLYIGSWKEISPPQIVDLKRNLDKVAYVYAPLFAASFIDHYQALIDLCYSTFTGWGEDAKLRTLIVRRRDAAGPDWNADWNSLFDEANASDPHDIRDSYKRLVSFIAEDVGIGMKPSGVTAGLIPGNIRWPPIGRRRITSR